MKFKVGERVKIIAPRSVGNGWVVEVIGVQSNGIITYSLLQEQRTQGIAFEKGFTGSDSESKFERICGNREEIE